MVKKYKKVMMRFCVVINWSNCYANFLKHNTDIVIHIVLIFIHLTLYFYSICFYIYQYQFYIVSI